VYPDPASVISSPAGPMLFNFTGYGDWVNGAMQLVNQDTTPIVLDTITWTKLYQACFTMDDPNPDVLHFCPSLVWDMEQDPENGGFLNADDGVVITAIDPDPVMESRPTNEYVDQFNWIYIGSGAYPWGQPEAGTCIPLNQPLEITGPADMILEFNDSTA